MFVSVGARWCKYCGAAFNYRTNVWPADGRKRAGDAGTGAPSGKAGKRKKGRARKGEEQADGGDPPAAPAAPKAKAKAKAAGSKRQTEEEEEEDADEPSPVASYYDEELAKLEQMQSKGFDTSLLRNQILQAKEARLEQLAMEVDDSGEAAETKKGLPAHVVARRHLQMLKKAKKRLEKRKEETEEAEAKVAELQEQLEAQTQKVVQAQLAQQQEQDKVDDLEARKAKMDEALSVVGGAVGAEGDANSLQGAAAAKSAPLQVEQLQAFDTDTLVDVLSNRLAPGGVAAPEVQHKPKRKKRPQIVAEAPAKKTKAGDAVDEDDLPLLPPAPAAKEPDDEDFEDASEEEEESEQETGATRKPCSPGGPGVLANLLQLTLALAGNLPEAAKRVLEETIAEAKKEVQQREADKQRTVLEPPALDATNGLSPLAALAPGSSGAAGGAGAKDSRLAPY